MQFDAPVLCIEACLVAERIEVEVGRQLAIDPHQQVQVELGRDAFAIVVGGNQQRAILRAVGADDQQRIGPDQAADAPQQGHRRIGREGADRRTGKEDHAPARIAAAGTQHGQLGQRLDAREVGHDRQHAQAGVQRRQVRHRLAQELPRDVDRQVGLRRVERIEQQARPAAGAAQLDDDGARPGRGGHLVRARPEDLQLVARGVVLVQARDLLEQLRPPVVVQPDRRDRLLRLRQPGQHLALERRRDAARPELAHRLEREAADEGTRQRQAVQRNGVHHELLLA
jgi:hypothetical protein